MVSVWNNFHSGFLFPIFKKDGVEVDLLME